VTAPRRRLAPSFVRTTVALALAGGSLTVATALPAEAADPTTIQLLGINDFHGRIDNAITPTFATTIEQLRLEDPNGDGSATALVGAGDLIGASLFASSSQQDNPTIDVLNALGLDASAVGNHEFDQGFSDLTDRVIPAAEWQYLGANVYDAGTTDPALPEYAILDVDGVKVGVIGAVTEETPSLVSPAGVADLDFGDPVEAVNRVAAEIDSQVDVTVATFHEGSASGATYEEAVAAGGPFAEIVEDTAPSVDVIFTGHTHRAYAFNAPIPGEDGETRPVLQTGSYAANVGKVTVTVDTDTNAVSAYTMENRARVAAADQTLPVVAEVTSITSEAVTESAAIGNRPVGEVTADVARAMVNPTTDDRGLESSLSNLVANALRDSLASTQAGADLGVVNPGGVRADLTYAGNTADNPANTDGVVTYAEANGVLPFVNSLGTVTLTGAELKQVLEQQWQPAGASRPFLHLGLSDNVQTTFDPTQPEGSRITSVLIDGEPLVPGDEYRVATFSFLAAGGDNFTAFQQGTFVDSGLVDRDAWIAYLGDNSPVSPSFARRQVQESGLPATVSAGEDVSFTLSKLDMTSVAGSVANTEVEVSLRPAGGGERIAVDTYDVTGGVATVAFTPPVDLVGDYTVVAVAKPTGTTVGTGLARAVIQTTAVKAVYGKPSSLSITIDSAPEAVGDVEVLKGNRSLGTATLSGGTASVPLGATVLRPGKHTLRVEYAGSDDVAPASTTLTLQVAKANAKVSATSRPVEVRVDRTRAKVTAVVSTTGFTPAGRIEVRTGGEVVGRGTLSGGKAVVEIKPFRSTGKHTVVVKYLGSSLAKSASDSLTIRVTK